MNLTQKLEKRKKESDASAEPRVVLALDAEIDDLSRSGIDDRALKVGDTAPDFELLNQLGEPVRLTNGLRQGPMVVSFYRGGWCSYCNLEMQALQSALSQIEGLGARILSISPQRADYAMEMCKKYGIGFDLLSDVDNSVARQFGIVFHLQDEIRSVYSDLGLDLPAWNNDDSFDLPVPATYVIDTQSVIRMAFVDPDYTRRLDPVEIIRLLNSIGSDA